MNQSPLTNLLQTSIAIVLLIGIAVGTLPAQATRKAPVNQLAKTAAVKAGWSGVITYTKSLEDTFTSDEQLLGKVNKEERIKHDDVRTYRYEGRLVVNDIAGTGRPTTSARIGFSDWISRKVIQTEFTNCHSWSADQLITAKANDSDYTVGSGGGEADSYSLSVYGETFRLNFTLPGIQGTVTKESSTSYANLCPDSTRTPTSSTKTNAVKIERGGAEIEGRIDPRNPDVLTGSKSWTTGVTSTSKGFTHTVTWKLRRKPQPLMITDVRFYQPLYPSPNDWREIDKNWNAVDGNQVKVIATVANFGSTDKTATVNFKELRENIALPNGPVSVSVPSNSQKDVELIWDTSGYAWRESGADVVPETNRQVEVTIPDDSMEKDLKIIPKPVIVVWGFWQSQEAMGKFHSYFKAVSDKWGIFSARTDVTKVSAENADRLDYDVREVQRGLNAWHVDLVSLMNGGLVGRVYVHSRMPTQFDGRPTATHLIMAGVPNQGTPFAIGLHGLALKFNAYNMDAVAELAPDSMTKFNLLVNTTNGTKFAALAGEAYDKTCQAEVSGDGVSPVPSAIWRTKVHAVSRASVYAREFIGEVAHFRQIYKWLAIPPKGDHAPDPSTLAGNFSNENILEPSDAWFGKKRFYGAMFASERSVDGADPVPDFAKALKLEAGKSAEVEIPVKGGSRFSLNLFASPNVSATLFDEQGRIIGKNVVGSAESLAIFRTITVSGPFQAGKWKLKLESTERTATEVAVTAFVDFNSAMFAGK